jgi:glycosyltransferase involved in cell wall biosynthesis
VSDALRIAVDMTFPNRNTAGSSVYATELLRELEQCDDVAVIEVAANAGGLPGTLGWLMGGARAAVGGTQLVHCPAFVAPWGMSRPFVLTVHDTSILDFPEDHAFEWRTYIRMFLARRARAATRVITGTEHSRRDIAQDLGVPAERIAVTPYGVAARFARPPAPRMRGGEPPQLLFPGAPTRRKNLELVLHGMAEAPPESVLRRATLVITGAHRDGFPAHCARIKALGLEGRVSWRGSLPLEQMPDLMQASDLVVYPSLQEGFGFPALEAMSAGTPVIASNASCLPEVLGEGALLVAPTDVQGFIRAAEAVLTRADLRQELAAKGRARAAQYTWRRCADLTIDVYREAAASATRTGGGSR